MSVKRLVPSIGNPNWDIKECSKEERDQIKNRLHMGLVITHDEYRAVISYMYRKFPHEMDGVAWKEALPNGDVVKHDAETSIQWKYATPKREVPVHNSVLDRDHAMYAFILQDPERDMEPVAFAGSYITVQQLDDQLPWNDELLSKYECDEAGKLCRGGGHIHVGNGIVMYIDHSYRRMGLATDLWWAEAELYRKAIGTRVQKEIQNTYSLVSTQKMFSDPSKCVVTSKGRLKNDGTYAQIRCLLDYEDSDLIAGFNQMPENLKNIFGEVDWRFLDRENLTIGKLLKPWEG